MATATMEIQAPHEAPFPPEMDAARPPVSKAVPIVGSSKRVVAAEPAACLDEFSPPLEATKGLCHLSQSCPERGACAHGARGVASTSQAGDSDDEDVDCCCICLEPFTDDNPAIATKCKHDYHLQCIMQWYQKSAACPLCGVDIKLEDAASDELLRTVAPPTRDAETLIRGIPLAGFHQIAGIPIAVERDGRARRAHVHEMASHARYHGHSRTRSMSLPVSSPSALAERASPSSGGGFSALRKKIRSVFGSRRSQS